jgi:O-antigen/teichoic acid export membrane protein
MPPFNRGLRQYAVGKELWQKTLLLWPLMESLRRRISNRLKGSSSGYGLGSRLARGAFWSLLGAVGFRGLGLLSSVFVARLLGKVGFGELGIIQSTVEMFGVFAGFGMGLTATKYVAEFRTTNPAKAGRILALSGLVALVTGLLMAVTLILLAPWLALNTLAAPQLSGLLQVSSGILLLSALVGAQTGALVGFESFKTIAQIGLWTGLAGFFLRVGGVYLAGLPGAVWGMVAALGVNCLLNQLALRRESVRLGVPLGFEGSRQEWQVLWKFSLPAVMSGAMAGPVTWACNAMIVNQPNGYAEMGAFNAANQGWVAVTFLPGVAAHVILPLLCERMGNQDRDNSIKIVVASIKLIAVITLPIIFFGCIMSPYIMQVFGESFKNEWPTLVVALLSAGIFAIHVPIGNIITASGKMWISFILNLVWGLSFILITWLLTSLGALGLALSRGAAYSVLVIVTLAIAYPFLSKNRTSGINGQQI